jgi:type 1 glutamine amidotransferase
MKSCMTKILGCLAALTALLTPVAQGAEATPKKLLVVTVVKTFRHSSIDLGEKIVAELGQKSGAFTVDYVRTDADMAKKMTPEALKNYDGVFFLSTTGEMPFPDKTAFLDWIKSGKGFVGVHAATDTCHGSGPGVDPYIEMIGGEFVTHAVAPVECIVVDPEHPATKGLPKPWKLTDEIYIMKNYDRTKVHELLILDKALGSNQPGFFPIAWCKNYGKGRVFYSALGHFENVWESPEYQMHILGGIKWALGLEKGDATPQRTAEKK